jgi:two-component system, sensor histidine kinase ChiS
LGLVLLGVSSCGPTPPRARHGEINLEGWDFLRGGSVPLEGEWEVFRDELLDPGELARLHPDGSRQVAQVPGAWNRQVTGGRWPDGQGVATYRLTVKSTPARQPMALFVQEQRTAYRLWWNGQPVAENGVVGMSREQSRAECRARMTPVELAGGHAQLVLAVSNFASRNGGPTWPVVLGEYDVLKTERQRWRDLDILLFGSLSVMALYHAGLFLMRRKERPALYIALVSAAFALRIPICGLSGRLLGEYLPGLPWELYARADPLLILLGVTAIVCYVAALLASPKLKTTARWTFLVALALSLPLVLLPRRLTEIASPLWFVVSALVSFYLLGIGLKATWRREAGGWTIVLGWFVMATAGLLEVVTQVLGSTGVHLPYVPLGVFAFLLMQSWVVAHRLDLAFAAVESLSTELQRKNVELRRLETLKDEFLANTSHELRTPVHGMVGLTESLLRGAAGRLTSAAQETLALILSSGRRLGSLISDIQDLTRLRRDDLNLRVTRVDPRALASAVVGLLDPMARGKGLVLANDIPQDMPSVRADENRLHQVLVNLVGNAIKFTEQGEVRVAAEVHERDIQLVVTDTGIGIPTDKLEVIFERCRQLETDTAGGRMGAGLGLAIARKLVTLHGGTLTAQSQPGKGSRFIVSLPIWEESVVVTGLPSSGSGISLPENGGLSSEQVKTATAAIAPATFPSTPTDSPVQGFLPTHWRDARVLVVDDDAVNLRIVASRLTLAGATVQVACSGRETLQLVREKREEFDLILLDVMMPGLNGFEVTRLLRERYPAPELPIILLTARAETSDLLQGFRAGANDYLTKPFSPEELLTRGQMHLAIKRAFAALKGKVALERELERQREKKEHARLKAEHERLEKLRYQLNPHFLFNALTAIRGALTSDVATAREMISTLGEFCRLTLELGQRDVLPLADELGLARLYLRMDEARRQQPLQTEWQCPAELDGFLVPTFLLQPLVENAVKYGRRTCTQAALRIRIAAESSEQGGVLLRVANAGTWVPEQQTDRPAGGVGLDNVRRRLRHYFGDEAGLEIDSSAGWVNATIRLPRPAEAPPYTEGFETTSSADLHPATDG